MCKQLTLLRVRLTGLKLVDASLCPHTHTRIHARTQKLAETHTHTSTHGNTHTWSHTHKLKLWTGSCGLFSSACFTPVGQNGGTVTYTQTYTRRHTHTHVHTVTYTQKQTVHDEGKNDNQQRSEGVKLPSSNFSYQAST